MTTYDQIAAHRAILRAQLEMADRWQLGGIGYQSFREAAIAQRYHLSEELDAVEGLMDLRTRPDETLTARASWLRGKLGLPARETVTWGCDRATVKWH